MDSSNSNGIHKSEANSPGAWSTGLYGCFSDVPNCCMTLWCPCITFGRIAEIVDKGSNSCMASGAIYTLIAVTTGCSCIYSWYYSSKLKKQYNLPEKRCSDCMIHVFCEPCVLCQEYREIKNRGFDMSIGWQGNMEKMNPEIKMAPVVPGGMDR